MSAGKDPGDAGAVRRRQLLLFSVIAAVLLVVVAVWLGMGSGKQSAPRSGIEAEIAGPDAAEKVWTRRSEARLGGIETQLRELRQQARTLRADNERLRGKLEADAADARGTIDRQAAVIDELERRLQPPRAAGQRPGQRGRQRPLVPGRARAATARRTGAAGADRTGADDRDLRAEGGAAVFRTRCPQRRRAGRGCGGEAGLELAAGGRPCRGRGAGRRRRFRRGLFPGRPPPGARYPARQNPPPPPFRPNRPWRTTIRTARPSARRRWWRASGSRPSSMRTGSTARPPMSASCWSRPGGASRDEAPAGAFRGAGGAGPLDAARDAGRAPRAAALASIRPVR